MGYFICDANGFVDDLCSNMGLANLHKYAEKTKMKELQGFLNKGAALITKVLDAELRRAIPKDKNVRNILERLIGIMGKSDLVMIICDGAND